ncbi:MAG: 4Fe-4S dicluster domain-containing protein, partial [Gammaproteobacteria bacterium]
VDPDATPACVNACISGALSFGDIENEESPVFKILSETEHFRMYEELGTEPGFYYLWDKKPEDLLS